MISRSKWWHLPWALFTQGLVAVLVALPGLYSPTLNHQAPPTQPYLYGVSSLRWLCRRLNFGSHESERARGGHARRVQVRREPPSHTSSLCLSSDLKPPLLFEV